MTPRHRPDRLCCPKGIATTTRGSPGHRAPGSTTRTQGCRQSSPCPRPRHSTAPASTPGPGFIAAARFCLGGALVLAASVAPAEPPNLVVNPGFDTDLSGWDIAFGRPAQWDPEDLMGTPGSGSARLTHVEPSGGGFLTILRQCIPIDGPGDFRISGWVRNLPDQAVPGSAAILVAPVRNADCTGGAGSSTGTLPVSSTTWQYNETDFSVSHAVVPFAAIEVRLTVLKAQAVTTPRVALFDEIELVSLTVGDAIFASGFEEP